MRTYTESAGGHLSGYVNMSGITGKENSGWIPDNSPAGRVLRLCTPLRSCHFLCSAHPTAFYMLTSPLVLRFGLPPSVSCFGLAADCLQSYYPISHASSMRRRRTWPTCLYLVCIFTCIVFPPSGHSTLPIASLTWPLSFSVYFPSFSLLSDSLYFRPATFPPPALVSDSRSIFRHVLTLRCTVYRHMYLAYSGLTFKSILLIVISHYDITRSPC